MASGFSFEGEGAAAVSGRAVAPESERADLPFSWGIAAGAPRNRGPLRRCPLLLDKSSKWQLKTLKKKVPISSGTLLLIKNQIEASI